MSELKKPVMSKERTKISLQTPRCLLIALIVGGVTVQVTAGSFPAFKVLTNGPWRVQLLPGQSEFVFTMYGAPAELEPLRHLVAVMQEQKLGNGFDPGPAARAINKPAFDYLASIGWPVIAYPGCAD